MSVSPVAPVSSSSSAMEPMQIICHLINTYSIMATISDTDLFVVIASPYR